MPVARGDKINGRSFDYVIIGGGTAGCVLASRLSEDPANRVLLLEAGKSDGNMLHARIPLLYPQLHTDIRYDWGFETVKQKHAHDRQLIWPRGKMLGGCSNVNAMILQQCAPADYDSWGIEGWTFDEFLPYFKKAEKYHPVDGIYYHEELHGTDGPWLTTSVKEQTALAPAFLQACEEEGIPRVHDINGHTTCGSITFQTFSYQGRRSAVSAAYLSRPVLARSNLTIALGCHVTKICFSADGSHAEAVQYQTKLGGPTYIVKATREVELCAGAIQSPHILMLSGIGPASHLKEHNIPVIHNLDGVGENLADHNRVPILHETLPGYSLNTMQASLPATLYQLYRSVIHRSGPLTVPIIEAAAYFRIPNGPDNSSSETSPHFEVFEAPYLINQDPESLKGTHGTTLLIVLLSPFSLGTVRLSTSNPWDKALVDPKVLSDERDVELFLAALKKTRNIAKYPGFARMLKREIQPGSAEHTDEQLVDYIRKEVVTTYHPTGTCKMGSKDDPMTVVDSNLIVHGTTNLRVVDCSIFPRIPGGQICWPTIATAEKAADMIKKHKLTSWPRQHNRAAKL
ncbi:hypothetical protein INT43_007091 [Umbelopsis isabellina]|uniref:Glucose-methanol-choline oxidoreductase N-terminal domain-containing protein n=1 Tax=Mortierella isabellina TaxID=91625 RepID=A0A8H7PZ90_MORIS|nr:hypothetical protein INT43_007091 [Umbelopsis isabellina]